MRELQEMKCIVVAGATDGPPLGSTRTDRHGARFAATHHPTGHGRSGSCGRYGSLKVRWLASPPQRGARYGRSRWVIVRFMAVSGRYRVLMFQPGSSGTGRRPAWLALEIVFLETKPISKRKVQLAFAVAKPGNLQKFL